MNQNEREFHQWQDTLYKRFRNIIFHSPGYVKFFKQKYPQFDAHHLTGSMGSLKLCDALMVELERPEHNNADLNRELYFFMYLPNAIQDFLDYVDKLEQKLKRIEIQQGKEISV